jgi:hypothetical protein
MWRILLRMIANGSLSAFSASALQGLPSHAGVRPFDQQLAQQVRQSQVQPPQVQPPTFQSADPAKSGAAPGRILPRGSLLDLSV